MLRARPNYLDRPNGAVIWFGSYLVGEISLEGGAVATGGRARGGTIRGRGARRVAAGRMTGLLELGDLDGLNDTLEVDADNMTA